MLQVVSFPKSGRTWLRVMLDRIGVAAAYRHDGADHRTRLPLTELSADKSGYRRSPVLLLLRDPRDTLVSGFFQAQKRLNLPVTNLSDFIRDPRHGIEKIIRFNSLWFAAGQTFKSFGIVSYESLHQDIETAVSAIVSFAGERAKLDRVSDAILWARFENMRAREVDGQLAGVYGEILAPADPADLESYKTRRGVVHGFVDYLSADDIAYCNQVLAESRYWESLDAALARFAVVRWPC